ncbi:MAG: PRC-barrel domain-containing protein [Verrucomicrobiota bacterium]
MKPYHRTLLFSCLPLITPIIATAAPDAEPKPVANAVTDTQSNPRLGSAWRASEVIGTNVKNSTDENIGEVKDIVIDLKSGEILAVIVSSGGFLGVADTLSAVPSSALRYDTAAKAFKTKITKEQLQRAPQHQAGNWPDYSNAAMMTKLREYRDSIGGDVNAADNTAKNEVDAKEETLTPVDQGTSESDIKTTKDIRAAVVKEEGLSFNAKNIKIITKDGHVTLRGVVDSTSEHETVVKIAGQHADSSNVTNDLRVK